MGLLDWLLVAAVLALAAAALRYSIRHRGCCGRCQGCVQRDGCRSSKKEGGPRKV